MPKYQKPKISSKKIKLSFFLSNVLWLDQFSLVGNVYAQSACGGNDACSSCDPTGGGNSACNCGCQGCYAGCNSAVGPSGHCNSQTCVPGCSVGPGGNPGTGCVSGNSNCQGGCNCNSTGGACNTGSGGGSGNSGSGSCNSGG